MVAKHSSKRPGATAPAPAAPSAASSPRDPAPTSDAVGLAPAVENAINAERRELQKAVAILGCLVIALEYGDDDGPAEGPDYSDVARTIRSMIARSITQLDPTNLERPVTQPRAAPDCIGDLGAPAS